MRAFTIFKSLLLLLFIGLILTLYSIIIINHSLAQEKLGEGIVAESVPYVTMLRASYTQGSVTINFEPLKEEDIRYRIYRSGEALKSEKELVKASPVAEINASELPFRDIPDKDGTYYYTVTHIRNGVEEVQIIPYHTTTTMPVDFSPLQNQIEELKVTPSRQPEPGKWIVNISFRPAYEQNTYNLYIGSEKLEGIVEGTPSLSVSGRTGQFSIIIDEGKPYYFIITTVNRLGVENPVIIPGRNENDRAFILGPSIKAQYVEKRIPLEKKLSPGDLIDINIRKNFYRGNYSRAFDEFQNLLKRGGLTNYQIALIHFYMGQCLFYMKKPREAVRYFILSKDHPSNANPGDAWIDRCLENLNE
jgi:hypothetical protein